MHELSIVQEIVNAIEQGLAAAGVARPVRVVHLTIGKLTSVVPDSVAFYFQLLTKGTPLQDAELVIRDVPIVIACDDCGEETTVEDINFFCGVCGSPHTNVVSGRELLVESVEVDDSSPEIVH